MQEQKINSIKPLEKQLAANERQEGGGHYKKLSIQCWDYINENQIGYLAGNVIKYVSRYKDKNGLEDLKKAKHYLDKLIESEYPEQHAPCYYDTDRNK